MSLKILKLDSRLFRYVLIVVALAGAITAWFFIKWNFVNIIASRIDTKLPESKPVVDWLTKTAPNDPATHLVAARVFERTFESGDLERSLLEHEMETALSPYNYLAWLDLGRVRSLSGDMEGSLAAYQRALTLAPNYATVQWACGNSLIRQGETSEGFSLIAKAAESRNTYTEPAVQTAWQIFDGDMDSIRQALGNTNSTNAALAAVLAGQSYFDQAFEAWSQLPDTDKRGKFRQLGEKLIEKFAAGKKFQVAAKVTSSLRVSESERPEIGQISNGGFEDGVKLRDASLFEWQIAAGTQPQIGLSEDGPHSGKFSLRIMFSSFETSAFRSISQTIAVVPGAEYEFEAFYSSNLRTSAILKWEIANALTAAPIASTQALTPAVDWTPLKVKFLVPADCDGLIIRLVREGCAGPSCPINGDVGFDDISLKQL